MPLIGIDCPKHGQLSFEEAVSGKCDCTPRFLLDSIINVVRRDYHKGTIITPTTILGCLRETWLERSCDYYATADQLYYSWRGSLIHNILERPNLPHWISEKRYKKQIPGTDIIIEGTIDGYDELDCILWDIKTIGDKGMSYIIKDGAKEEHIQQLNIYRWMCPFKIEAMRIIYLSMMQFVLSGNLNVITQRYKNIPNQKKSGFKYYKQLDKVKGWSNYELYYETPDVPRWTDKEVLDFITPKATLLYDCFKNETWPPMCDKETQSWKCKRYCKVKSYCNDYEKKQKTKVKEKK